MGAEWELDGILAAMARFRPSEEFPMAEEAYYFSKKAHSGQMRHSGEPYFTHPAAVALLLAEKGLDEVVVSAGLLHDILEDTNTGPEEILSKFGKDVHGLVSGLTKLDAAAFRSRQESANANIIKTIMAASRDMRVIVIKLYDKLHNMRTIAHLEPEKRKRIAADALTVYVPIAHRLGMHGLKFELEDICFRVLEPEKFAATKKSVEAARLKKQKVISQAVSMLKKLHPDMEWEFGQTQKSVYSVYSKMIAQEKAIGQLNDTLILTAMVPQKDDCYLALGKIHSAFKPIPGKMKDMIAIPEFGICSALHIRVIGPDRMPLKIYILSQAMAPVAQEGIVALMRDNGGSNAPLPGYRKLFPTDSLSEAVDSEGITDSLNLESHNRVMIVFTHNADVVTLPAGSTALDFAFFSDTGHARNSAKAEVNGMIVPLWTRLNSGDVVRVHHSIISQLDPRWESFVHSEKARRLIQKDLRKKNITASSKLAKLTIEYIDSPGIFAREAAVLAKHGLDLEIVNGSCKSDRSSCKTEFFIRNSESSKLQKAIKQLRARSCRV